jgi:hypothetical protein
MPGTGELRLPGRPKTEPPLRPYAHNRLPAGVFTFAEMPPGSGIHVVASFEWDRPAGERLGEQPMTFDALRASVRRVPAALLAGTDTSYGRWYPDLRARIGAGRAEIDASLRVARPVLVRISGDADGRGKGNGRGGGNSNGNGNDGGGLGNDVAGTATDDAAGAAHWGDRLVTVAASPVVPAGHGDGAADPDPLPAAFVVRPDGYPARPGPGITRATRG